jgi:thioredoxin 2
VGGAPVSPSTVVECPSCGAKNRVPPAATGIPRCGRCKTPLPWVVDATDDDFAAKADKAALPVLVDLWAEWCGPCRMVSPILEKLALELAGRMKLVKVDVDRSPQLSGRFGVQSIPMLALLHHGEVVATKVGAGPEAALRSWLEDALAKAVADIAP